MDEYEIMLKSGEKEMKSLSKKAVKMLRRNPDVYEVRRNTDYPGVDLEDGESVWAENEEGEYYTIFTKKKGERLRKWTKEIIAGEARLKSGPRAGSVVVPLLKNKDGSFRRIGEDVELKKSIKKKAVSIKSGIDIDKWIVLAVGQAMVQESMSNLNRRETDLVAADCGFPIYQTDIGPAGLDSDKERLMGLRNFREYAAEFLINLIDMDSDSTYKRVYDSNGNIDKTSPTFKYWSEHAYFNKDEYEVLPALDAAAEMRSIREFETPEGKKAWQDSLGMPIYENGSMLYFPSEEEFDSIKGDQKDVTKHAFDFVTTYDRLMDLGTENSAIPLKEYDDDGDVKYLFKRGQVFGAFLVEYLHHAAESKTKEHNRVDLIKPSTKGLTLKMVDFTKQEGDVKRMQIFWEVVERIALSKIADAPPIKLDEKHAYYEVPTTKPGATEATTWGSGMNLNCGVCAYYSKGNCSVLDDKVKEEAICSIFTPTAEELLAEYNAYFSNLGNWNSAKIFEMIAMSLQLPEMIETRLDWATQSIMGSDSVKSLVVFDDSVMSHTTSGKVKFSEEMEKQNTKMTESVNDLLKKTVGIINSYLVASSVEEAQQIINLFGRKTEEFRKDGEFENPTVNASFSGSRRKLELRDYSDKMVLKKDVKRQEVEPDPITVKLYKARCKNQKMCLTNGQDYLSIHRKTWIETTSHAYEMLGKNWYGLYDDKKEFEKDSPDVVPIDGVPDLLCGPTERKVVYQIHGQRIKEAYEVFKTVIKFKDEMSAKIIFSSFLMKNGSIILKGVAGTGKTTMLEAITMLLGNDIDYAKSGAGHPDHELNETNTMAYLKDRKYGSVGIAKHNPDKQPDEIYYYARISEDSFTREDYIKWLQRKATKLQEEEQRKNPYSVAFIEESEDTDDPLTIPSMSMETIFDPAAMPIVTKPIKFHNEGNRMNKKVADVTLGLLAENEVEYKGETFTSPTDGGGSVTMLDYNPHIDWTLNGELDRALLDRFNCSVFVPALDLGNKIQLLGGMLGGTPAQQIQNAINNYVKVEAGTYNDEGAELLVNPLSVNELRECWKDVEQVTITRKTNFLVACYTNAFSMSFLKYPPTIGDQGFYTQIQPLNFSAALKGERGAKILGGKGDKPDSSQAAIAQMPFLDASVENYGFGDDDDENLIGNYFPEKGVMAEPMLNAMFGNNCLNADTPAGVIARMNLNYRPLGFRAARSLQLLAKSYTWLEAVLEDQDTSQGLFVTAARLKEILPYVMGHRLNIGLGDDVKNHFLNTEDWIENDVIDRYIDVAEANWNRLYEGVYQTLFGYEEAGAKKKGLIETALLKGKGSRPIDKELFMARYEQVCTRPGFFSDELRFYQWVMGDPISQLIYFNVYAMAYEICQEPCVWQPDKKDWKYGSGGMGGQYWLNTKDGTSLGVFKDME